jgi:hypothetical protein
MIEYQLAHTMLKRFKLYPKLFAGLGLFVVCFSTLFYPAYQYLSQKYFHPLPPPLAAVDKQGGFFKSVHPRSQKMSDLFGSANAVLASAIAKLEAAQYADQLPSFSQEMFEYRKQFIYYGTGMPMPIGIGFPNFFTRGTLSCKVSLESLAWLGSDVRQAFSVGEKPRLLAELRQKMAQLSAIQAACAAAAPHYYGTDKGENMDTINGDFDRASITVSPAGSPYFSVFIKTTVRTDEVQLLGLAPAASAELRAQALALIYAHCQGGEAQSLVAQVPSSARALLHAGEGMVVVRGGRGRRGGGGGSIDSPYAAGEVWCGSKSVNIGAALLRAGLATIDYAQKLSPKVTSESGNIITIGEYPEYFTALSDARQARRGIWTQGQNML